MIYLSIFASVINWHEPLTRYEKTRVALTPGMSGTFSRHRLQRKPVVSNPGMHHGIMHDGIGNPRWGGNVPGIPGACATHNFTYLSRGPWGSRATWPVSLKITSVALGNHYLARRIQVNIARSWMAHNYKCPMLTIKYFYPNVILRCETL